MQPILNWQSVFNALCARLGDPDFPAYDCIVGSGVSGMLFLTALAHKLGKSFLIVRPSKPLTGSPHSCEEIEGAIGGQRYVIVDDLIAKGATVLFIFRQLGHIRYCGLPMIPVAVVTYNQDQNPCQSDRRDYFPTGEGQIPVYNL